MCGWWQPCETWGHELEPLKECQNTHEVWVVAAMWDPGAMSWSRGRGHGGMGAMRWNGRSGRSGGESGKNGGSHVGSWGHELEPGSRAWRHGGHAMERAERAEWRRERQDYGSSLAPPPLKAGVGGYCDCSRPEAHSGSRCHQVFRLSKYLLPIAARRIPISPCAPCGY